jgi:hypothetical protein
MANIYLNPVTTPGMWSDLAPLSPKTPAATVHGATVAAEHNQPAPTGGAVAKRPKAIAWVKMAPDILRAMALAANHAGRTSGDVWAEAAQEWLLRKSLETEYDVLSNQPARTRDSAILEEKRSKLWSSIDSAMGDIRELRPTLTQE